MDTPTTNRRTGRRWRAPLAALAVGVVTATGAVPLLGSGTSASAIPICNDPAGCGPTSPFNPSPIPFPWNAKVAMLDQSSGGVNRTLDAQWLRLGIFNQVTGGGSVVWTNPEKTVGTLHTNTAPTPLPGSSIGFRVLEPGIPGRLCRLPKQSSMPPSNRTLRILAAPPSGKTASQLSMLAASFKGAFNIDDADVTISSTQLDSRTDGLFLTVRGHVWQDNQFPIPNVDANFTYKVLLHPRPSTSQLSMASVVTVAADKGDLDLTGGNILDKFLLQFASDKEPKFRSTVATKATTAFNDAIAADPNVSWFTSLGYSLTARRVTTSTTGIAIDGAFCRLGS